MNDESVPQRLIAALAELNPDALLFEPRDVYDRAIVGITVWPQDHWTRERPCAPVAVYDYGLLTDALVTAEGWTAIQAHEWLDFNTCGAWMGPGTPYVQTMVDG